MRASSAVLTGLRAVDLRLLDALAALVLSAGALAMLVPWLGSGMPVLTISATLATTTSVGWRRWSPLLAVLVAILGLTTLMLAESRAADGVITIQPIVLALDYYLLGRTTRVRADAAAAALGLALGALVPIAAVIEGGQSAADIVSGLLIWVVLPFAIGAVLTRWQTLTAARVRAIRDLTREQRLREAEAAEEERGRIARELHDAIAHNLSLMVIQTEASRQALPHDRGAARSALQVVIESGRDALEELRRIMGVVRREEFIGAGAPGFAGLQALLERTRRAGVSISLEIEGPARELPPALDLVVYRLVQEALTNALKHAGSTTVSVRIGIGVRAVEVEVTNTIGPRSETVVAGDGSGLGIPGMQERVALFGGELSVGPNPDGGYQVRAHLPVIPVAS